MNGGKYGFDSLDAGSYIVQIVVSTLPDSCRISDKQNQAGVADSLDSDFNTGGFSDVVVIDPSKTGLDPRQPDHRRGTSGSIRMCEAGRRRGQPLRL